MTTYLEWLPSLLPAPLAGRWGRAWAGVVGGALDEILTGAKTATKASMVGVAPADAMLSLGYGRAIGRLPGEDLEAYRIRLLGAWVTWYWAGSAKAIRDGLVLFGLRGVRVVEQHRWPVDTNASLWARFRVYVTGRATVGELVVPFEIGAYTGMGLDVGPRTIPFRIGASTVGSMLTRAQVDGIRAVIAQWKSARDRCHSVVFTRGGAVVGSMVVGHAVVGPGSFVLRGDPNFV